MKELLTVAEFSQLTGINKQMLYKLIETDLKPFYVYQNGLKMIKKEALSLYNNAATEPKEETKEEQAETPAAESEYIKYLKEEIKELKEQIKEKDIIIQEFSNKILEYAKKSQELTDKALTTTSQQQYLQAYETQKTSFFKRLFIGKKQGN